MNMKFPKANRFVLLTLAAIVLITTGTAHAQRPLTFEDVINVGRAGDAQISPDGEQVVYTVRTFDLKTNGSTQSIWLAGVDSGENRQLTTAPRGTRDLSPIWSADGKTLAFLSSRSGSYQIWTISLTGGEARRLTDFPLSVGGLIWSPDGSRFAFTAAVFPDCEGDVMACTAKRLNERADSGIEARVYDKLLVRHWDTWEDGTRSHMFVVPAEGGEAIDLTPGDSNVPPSLEGGTGYDFSPDGKEMAYARNIDTKEFADEALSTNSDVWVVPVTGGDAKRITDYKGWDGTPQYSPDGKYIAFVMMGREGFESDQHHLMLYERASGEARHLEHFDNNVRTYLWEPESGGLVFTASVDARAPIYRAALPKGEVTPVVEGVYAGSLSLSGDGKTVAFLGQSSHRPSEVFVANTTDVAGGAPRQISHINDAAMAGIDMNPVEPIYVKGAGGDPVHAWLIKPPGFDPAKKYPVVVLIHGGPQGTWGDSFHPRWNMQLFAAPGYVVVAPNPRGSPGWGQKFVDEISRDWGGKVYTDIMNVVDHVAALPYTDKKKMCAGGGSYGGYMTDWILGHTDRFSCLFSHAGVYNLESMYGATEELWFVEWDLGGPYWSHPEDYRKWSPHNFVEKFKTPTLVIQGGLDYRVPMDQSLQLFTHLQRRGIKSKFLYYPDENHWIQKPKNSQLWYKTVHDWLAEHLQ